MVALGEWLTIPKMLFILDLHPKNSYTNLHQGRRSKFSLGSLAQCGYWLTIRPFERVYKVIQVQQPEKSKIQYSP